MAEKEDHRRYDLEERTLAFSKRAVKLCRSLPRTVIDSEMGKQLVRSSTSVGANYIEANECLGKKDFLMRIRICRKEAKESGYWLRLVETASPDLRSEQQWLLQESTELMRIFGAIIVKSNGADSKS